VAGATVWLCLEPNDLIEGVSSGLVSSSEDLKAITDESGSFRIGSEYEGRDLWVRASKAGAASGRAGPVRVGGPPIEVQLTDGGTIEGALHLPEHRDAAGAQVELYRIDPSEWEVDTYGHFTVTCDPQDRFQFEHVEEGPWLVRLLVPKPIEHDRLPLPPEHVPFVVEVTAGASSHLDMDLTQEPLRLEGRPKINGKPWTKAYFVLHLAGNLGLTLDETESDRDGSWTLRVRSPGMYHLVAWGNHQHDTSVPRRVYDVIEASPTGARWDKDIAWDPRSRPEFRLDRSSR